jgi:hypothetical protein
MPPHRRHAPEPPARVYVCTPELHEPLPAILRVTVRRIKLWGSAQGTGVAGHLGAVSRPSGTCGHWMGTAQETRPLALEAADSFLR